MKYQINALVVLLCTLLMACNGKVSDENRPVNADDPDTFVMQADQLKEPVQLVLRFNEDKKNVVGKCVYINRQGQAEERIEGELEGDKMILRQYRKDEHVSYATYKGIFTPDNFVGELVENEASLTSLFTFRTVKPLGVAAQKKEENVSNDEAPSGQHPTIRYQASELNLKGGKVKYSLVQHVDGLLLAQGIIAEIGGASLDVYETNPETCLSIASVEDFNQDGYEDALINISTACGGNCCPNEFLFAAYNPATKTFVLTDKIGESWEEPLYQACNGKPCVSLVSSDQGVGNTEMGGKTIWASLNGFQLERKAIEHREITGAEAEIRSAALTDSEKKEGKVLSIDIDLDGKPDTITAQYWERWGSLQWKVTLSSKPGYTLEGSGKRIGVLLSKTKGARDIVSDLNDLYIWDGQKYGKADAETTEKYAH